MFLMDEGHFKWNEVENIYVYVDEHSTATNGRYELQEGLLQEFKYGTHNGTWNMFYPPVFPKLNSLNVEFCDSSKRTLVRAADIIANRVFFCAVTGQVDQLKLFTSSLP